MSRYPRRRRGAAKPKRGARAVRRALAKRTKRMAKKNMDTKFVKCVVDGIITPRQGGAVSNYIYGFVPLIDNTGTGTGVTGTTNFQVHQQLYDRVRVNSVKVTLTPKANTFDASQAQNDANLTLSGRGTLQTIIDRDGPGPWVLSAAGAMVDAWNQYPSVRTTSLLRKTSRVYSIKWPVSTWLDCQNLFTDSTLLNRLGALGGISFYAENLVEDVGEIFNEPWGSMRVEYNCVFEGLKSSQTSLDASGPIVTGKQIGRASCRERV